MLCSSIDRDGSKRGAGSMVSDLSHCSRRVNRVVAIGAATASLKSSVKVGAVTAAMFPTEGPGM